MKKEKPNSEKRSSGFTATEVGSMLESIGKEIRVVAEGHSDLDRRLGDLEVEIHGNTEKLNMLQIVSGVTKDKVSHLDNRVSLLDKKVGNLDQKVSQLDQKVSQLDQKVSQVGVELKSEIRELGNRLTGVENRR